MQFLIQFKTQLTQGRLGFSVKMDGWMDGWMEFKTRYSSLILKELTRGYYAN